MKVDSSRKTAIAVGVLFIIATAFLFVGQAIYGPYLDVPNYLEVAYPHRIAAVIGILIEFTCILAIPLIAIYLFPVARKYNEALALGYVGFRLLEAVLYMFDHINTLSLISVSEGYLLSEGADAAFYQNLGGALQAQNESAFGLYIVVFTLGAMMLYSLLYRSRLVPRFISIWGFLAAVLLLVGTLLLTFEALGGMSEGTVQLIFAPPIAVNEMVLAIWLIVKGFNSEALAAGSTA